ncbi:NHL repeat-containing protein [bacterium]|nr:NHL repeat-containing protein [bacterium]
MFVKIAKFCFAMTLLGNSESVVIAKTGFSEDTKIAVDYLFTFPEKPIQGLSLLQPQAIAIDVEGSVFIVDTGHNRVIKFNSSGEFVYSIGGFGWDREQFDRPLDISVKNGLDVFIADFNNERIERYDRKLNYISTFSTESLSGDFQFGFPGSVDISKHGELFICDNENDSIVKLDAFGQPYLRFGDFNWGDGQLEYPVKIDISRSDLVYVSDQGTNQIVVFDQYGNYVSRFGSKTLQKPTGLSWSDNRLYVADSGSHRIVVFDQIHQVIFSWGALGDKIGAFSDPVDVAATKDHVFVLDSGNARVQVFRVSDKDGSN